MVFFGLSTGPGLHGHDGWLTYEAPNGGGVLALDQIEIDEMTYPVLVEERKIASETMGVGQWNGAPAMQGRYRPLSGDMTVAYCSDGDVNPPRGVLGGRNGSRALNAKRDLDGHRESACPPFIWRRFAGRDVWFFGPFRAVAMAIRFDRDPTRVARDADRGWISQNRARCLWRRAGPLLANGTRPCG